MTATAQQPTLAETRQSLRDYIEKVTHNPAIGRELSSRIARFTAAAIREDRTARAASDTEFVRALDVFFNGAKSR